MVSEYDTLSDTFPSTVKTIQKHYKIRTAFFLDFRRHGPFSSHLHMNIMSSCALQMCTQMVDKQQQQQQQQVMHALVVKQRSYHTIRS